MRTLTTLSAAALAAGLIALTTPSALAAPTAPAAPASSYATITGSGSSWSSIGLADWINDVASKKLIVNYNADGAAVGREEYMQGGQVDFAASDPPFLKQDKLAGTGAEVPEWGYLPITPVLQFGDAKMENGSNNVADYITASFGNGSIGFLEDSYLLNSGYPAVSVRNPAGKFVQPTPADVTAALTKAVINENPKSVNFLQQNLGKVYTNMMPGSYPLASYSYLIVPRTGTKVPPAFTTAAGTSLRAFLRYGLCQGQKGLAALGYAPLPASLVKGGLQQVAHIPGNGSVPASCT
ncbi:MAG TPA: hypothetical protein VGH27_24895 [Streptosporangiaceae bacterium]|jgi:ABC-type phosphate transport system substrate-binding protein